MQRIARVAIRVDDAKKSLDCIARDSAQHVRDMSMLERVRDAAFTELDEAYAASQLHESTVYQSIANDASRAFYYATLSAKQQARVTMQLRALALHFRAIID